MANSAMEVEPMNPDEVKQYLKIYYDRVFPFDLMGEWLSYGENKDQPNTRFSRREFSFTTTMRDGSDVYSRYNSYKDVDDWRRDLVKTRANNPVLKIDIGAIYNVAPKQHQTTMVPEEKELVFDIDMTDYNDVRGCECKQRATPMCALCWPLMRVAAQVLEHVLKEEFGYEHLMFIYSGRRGIHCWVLDHRARTLTHEQRAAIGQYLSVTLKGGEGVPTRPELYTVLHPSLKWAYDHVLEPYFKQRVADGFLAHEEMRNKILAYLPLDLSDSLVADIGTGEVDANNSEAVWRLIVDSVTEYKKKFSMKSDPIRDIIFTFSYPRLDIEVTKQMNHLLKSPFVPHRDTGRICVPIADMKSFNPDAVPTLAHLVDQVTAAGTASNTVRDYENTDLKPYLEYFKTIIRKANATKATSNVKTDW